MIVVDANVLVVALGNDGKRGDVARARLAGEELAAPDLLDLEVLSVLRRALHRREITGARADAAATALDSLDLERYRHKALARRCWELRENLTPYDSAYVALAEGTDTLLVTADGPLARAPGPRCRIEHLLVGGPLGEPHGG